MNNQEAWPTKGQRLSEPNNIPIIREGNFLKIDSFLGKTQGDRKANEGLKTNKDPVHPEKKKLSKWDTTPKRPPRSAQILTKRGVYPT